MSQASRALGSEVHDWHPRLQALHAYWLGIHPSVGLPGRQHFDPAAFRDLLPMLWLVDVHREPFRFRYRLVGTAIREAAERELTGLWLEEAQPHLADSSDLLDRFKEVVRTGRASRRRGKPTLFLAHKDHREIENVLLPLAADGRIVDVILAATVFHRSDDQGG